MKRDAGQVLAFFAVVMPIVLLPLGAYAVDAAVVAFHAAGLQAATAEAAETAAQQLNIGAIRAGSGLALDAVAARQVASRTLAQEEPGAIVDSSSLNGVDITLITSESVTIPFAFLSSPITLHAHATARLVMGYDRSLS